MPFVCAKSAKRIGTCWEFIGTASTMSTSACPLVYASHHHYLIKWWTCLNLSLNINHVLHYLDDFFFVEPDNSTYRASMTRVKDKAHQLGVLVEPSKETSLTTTITFLGIKLDSEALVARLPPEKLRDLMDEIPQ